MNYYKKEKQNNFLGEKNKRLFISISVDCDEHGNPIDTIMKHRYTDSGKWDYCFDLDSGEQDQAKRIPNKVKELLKGMKLNMEQ